MESQQQQPSRGEWTSARKSTEAARRVRGLVKQMYIEGQQALAEGQPVAWVLLAVGNNFIFKAMDIVPLMPENFGGLCATKRVAQPYIDRAEAEGYSNVLCGYARTHLGYCMRACELGEIPPEAPDGGMVKPTVIVGNSNTCDDHIKWAQAMGRYFDVPAVSYDVVTPSPDVAFRQDVREQYIRYNVDQNRKLIQFLEEHTGHKMDWHRLRHLLDVAHKTSQVYAQAGELRKAVPCPMPTEDQFNIFVPNLMMPGDERALKFYEDLIEELRYRVEHKIGVIPDEKYRLIWGPGLPPWHTMKMFQKFESLGAVFVWEIAYKTPEILPDIPDRIADPLERWAWGQYEGFLQKQRRSVVGGYNLLEMDNPLEWIGPFQADGVVFHWLKSCRATTIGQRWYENLVKEHSGVPTLQLESDICDLRDMAEADWSAKIEAFIEVVDAHKERKKRG